MSVTFTLAASDGRSMHIGIPCRCFEKFRCECEEALMYGGLCEHNDEQILGCEHKALDVNVNNANAWAILGGLGLSPDVLVGSMDARDFLALVRAHSGVHRAFELETLARDALNRGVSVGWA